MSHSPLAAAIGVSIGLHVLLVAVVFFIRPAADAPMVKRGEPLIVELPEAEQAAQRGAPPPTPPAPKAPPTPTAPPAKSPPQPKVAASPPQPPRREAPAQREARAPTPLPREETRTPSQPTRPAASEPPAPDGVQAATQAPQPAAPPASEQVSPPAPRETAPASPPPQVAAIPPRPPLVDGLAVLRRHGPGGAGGSGEAWAGIEGEPIPLDSPQPKLRDYLDRVRRMIKEKWVWQCINDRVTGHCEHKAARLVVEFGILKDGGVPTVVVRSPSEYEVMDEWAVNAIKLASPFPPVPPELMAMAKPGSTGVRIQAHFAYILEPARIIR